MKNIPGLFLALAMLVYPAGIFSQDPANFKRSLHYTRAGAEYWYRMENGGFENLTKMEISKDCMNCHSRENARGNAIIHDKYEPSCFDCHDGGPKNSVNNQACLNCHSHQTAEFSVTNDVHRAKGMICIDCHTKYDMHGNGSELRSLYEGSIEKTCETCHENIKQSVSHTVHNGSLDCSACHVSSQVTCFNCHFESGKINSGLYGYVLLARNSYTKKVQAANYMGLTFKDRTFLVIGPYKAHSVTKEGRKCSDCHNNAALQKYLKTGKINLTYWDEQSGKAAAVKGVIPVPGDWKKAITADFVYYDESKLKNNGWSLLKRGIDKIQMMFLEPLDDKSIKKLNLKH